MGGLDAINMLLFGSASDLQGLQTVLNAGKSMVSSFIITKKSKWWLRSAQGAPSSRFLLMDTPLLLPIPGA